MQNPTVPPVSLVESSAHTRAHKKRIVLAATIGNGLATYDFTVYSFSAMTIGKLFFPSDSAFESLLMSLLTFGAGFAIRPIGALVIGNLADRKGRKAGLMCSISVISSLGTTIFGGFCSFVVAWMIGVTGNAMAPAWYLLAAMCISLFALMLFPDSLERLRSIRPAGCYADAATP